MSEANQPQIIVRELGFRAYVPTWQAMRRFTNERLPETKDEVWLVQHPPVYTLGVAAKTEHLLHPGDIPVVRVDRGGQVTYHGPGQIVAYPLLNLRRAGLGVKSLVGLLEQAVVDLLATYAIPAQTRANAPGVYVAGGKIAAVGLRIRNGCCFHGVSLNVSMDLEPFSRINPCGFPGLPVTQVADHNGPQDPRAVGRELARFLGRALHYSLEPAESAMAQPEAPAD